MLIRDHINLMGVNPLRGANDERFGARFPDMTEVYARISKHCLDAAEEMAQEKARKRENANGKKQTTEKILRRGVYCGLSGPTYETPAEIRMFRLLGADAVGMSTVPEAIAARHQGIKVLAFPALQSRRRNERRTINHEEVMETGAKVAETFKELLEELFPN